MDLKSAPQDQMEMMLMMEKIDADFFNSYSEVTDLPSPEFPPPNSSSSPVSTHFLDSHNSNQPSFLNLPSPLDQSHSPPLPLLPSFLSSNPRWRDEMIQCSTATSNTYPTPSQKKNSMAAMREMIFRIAAMQPIHIDPESVKPPKRRNVKISKDPQSVAARHRRERISERIRILQRLVPGGTKMDTASMLDEAIHYVKFLKTQVQSLERAQANRPTTRTTTAAPPHHPQGIGFPVAMSSGSYLAPLSNNHHHHNHHHHHHQNLQNYGDV